MEGQEGWKDRRDGRTGGRWEKRRAMGRLGLGVLRRKVQGLDPKAHL